MVGHHSLVLTEEVPKHFLATKKEHITVVCHRAVHLVGVVKMGTLGLSLHGTDDVRQTK